MREPCTVWLDDTHPDTIPLLLPRENERQSGGRQWDERNNRLRDGSAQGWCVNIDRKKKEEGVREREVKRKRHESGMEVNCR